MAIRSLPTQQSNETSIQNMTPIKCPPQYIRTSQIIHTLKGKNFTSIRTRFPHRLLAIVLEPPAGPHLRQSLGGGSLVTQFEGSKRDLTATSTALSVILSDERGG